jgi:hypothetical protein
MASKAMTGVDIGVSRLPVSGKPWNVRAPLPGVAYTTFRGMYWTPL